MTFFSEEKKINTHETKLTNLKTKIQKKYQMCYDWLLNMFIILSPSFIIRVVFGVIFIKLKHNFSVQNNHIFRLSELKVEFIFCFFPLTLEIDLFEPELTILTTKICQVGLLTSVTKASHNSSENPYHTMNTC